MKGMERTNDSVFHFVVEFKPYYHIAPVYPTLPAQLDIRLPVSRVHAYIYIYTESRNLPQTSFCPYRLTCSVRRWADLG